MRFFGKCTATAAVCAMMLTIASAQMIDNTQAPNTAKAGINKSLLDEIGAGRGNVLTPGSSVYIINRDPFRSIRRGRQLFQRKFTRVQGQGANEGDGSGDINTDIAIGAGLSDSCALCHGRPRGSAGAGGNVVTRPDSRDAGHLFGLGLKEMLADEITELDLELGRHAETGALLHRGFERLQNYRRRMAEYKRPPREDKVDVFLAVGVPDSSAFSARPYSASTSGVPPNVSVSMMSGT